MEVKIVLKFFNMIFWNKVFVVCFVCRKYIYAILQKLMYNLQEIHPIISKKILSTNFLKYTKNIFENYDYGSKTYFENISCAILSHIVSLSTFSMFRTSKVYFFSNAKIYVILFLKFFENWTPNWIHFVQFHVHFI